MYTDNYRDRTEITGMQVTIDTAKDGGRTPADALLLAEDPTVFERLLDAAVTTDERRLLRLIDALLDEAWRFETSKALRGELRRLWTLRGLSGRRFYAAFHGLAERRQRA